MMWERRLSGIRLNQPPTWTLTWYAIFAPNSVSSVTKNKTSACNPLYFLDTDRRPVRVSRKTDSRATRYSQQSINGRSAHGQNLLAHRLSQMQMSVALQGRQQNRQQCAQ